ncbi:MAG: pyridoxal phosphate-dependent decarboxylase family protein [Pyrinomonadaceae bacterium]
MIDEITQPEETLDPQNWDDLRALGHRMLDDMIEHLSTLRERSAWQDMPDTVRRNLTQPLPREPQGEEAVYQEFLQNVLPYSNGARHPRFFGWVQGNGTPLGMLADMLAAAMNPHMAGFNQAPTLVEQQVVRWLAQLMGFPPDASGVLQSGGTMANIVGTIVARHAKAGFDVRQEGLQGTTRPRLLIYGSSETHRWIVTAAELLGLGSRAFRRVPVDHKFCIDTAALRRMIAEDKAAGHKPFCVVGTAGTVNTGATDDLTALAQICREEDLWFHVDGAFGAWAKIVPELQSQVAGLEQADSVAFDLHKWMYLPFEIACVLVRDDKTHRDAFAHSASYIAETTRGVIAGGLPFAERGIELTRGFKALKVWMNLKAYGVEKFSRLIKQNVHQARYLAHLVNEHSDLELLAPVPLNIVCFRFRAEGLSEKELNKLNEEILIRVQESGAAVPSGTIIGEAFALRAAIVNHRSRREDFDLLIKTVVECGKAITLSQVPPAKAGGL